MLGRISSGGRPRLPQFRAMNPVPIGVGFVVVMLLLVYLAFNIDKIPSFGGTTYSAAFAEAGGLRKGDKVRVAGVAVGQVDSIDLEGTHVKVTFTLGGVRLGTQTTASIQIFTLLGNKYVEIDPAGPGHWPAGRELPLARTTSPYDVVPAFADLSNTIGDIDTKQLANAFDTLAATFKDSPPQLRDALKGLSALSTTIASRDQQLTQLLQHTDTLTAVLADRRQQFATILGDGDKLLQMVIQRRQVISDLLANTTALSQQLTGLVKDNQATLKPMLDHLHGVSETLQRNQADLDQSIRLLYPWVRNLIDVVGSGPWFEAIVENLLPGPLNPPDVLGGGIGKIPQTLGQLLGIPLLGGSK